MVGIYKILSPTGKVYIGQSFDLNKRKNNYRFLGCKSQSKLYRSLLRHSWDKHSFEVIHDLPDDINPEIVTRYEQLYMDLYKDCGIELLNLREAGLQGPLSPEDRLKLIGRPSPTKGRKQSLQTRQNRSNSMKGVKKTQQHKENMRIGRAKKNPTEWRLNLGIAQKRRFEKESSPRKIDRESLWGVVADYKNTSLTVSLIALKYKISKNTVDRVLRENDVKRRPKGNPGVKRKHILNTNV